MERSFVKNSDIFMGIIVILCYYVIIIIVIMIKDCK